MTLTRIINSRALNAAVFASLLAAILMFAVVAMHANESRLRNIQEGCERGNHIRAVILANNALAIQVDRAVLLSDNRLAPETVELLRDVIAQRIQVRTDPEFAPVNCNGID